MFCYLAHPITDYGNGQRQVAALKAIAARGWTAVSPDAAWHAAAYKERGMDHFVEVVRDCDALAFIRMPSGAIGAGVAKEIEAALACKMPVFDVTGGSMQALPSPYVMPEPVLTVDETRAELAAIRAAA